MLLEHAGLCCYCHNLPNYDMCHAIFNICGLFAFPQTNPQIPTTLTEFVNGENSKMPRWISNALRLPHHRPGHNHPHQRCQWQKGRQTSSPLPPPQGWQSNWNKIYFILFADYYNSSIVSAAHTSHESVWINKNIIAFFNTSRHAGTKSSNRISKQFSFFIHHCLPVSPAIHSTKIAKQSPDFNSVVTPPPPPPPPAPTTKHKSRILQLQDSKLPSTPPHKSGFL